MPLRLPALVGRAIGALCTRLHHHLHRLVLLLTSLLLCTTVNALVFEDKWTASYGCCTFTPEGTYYGSAQEACKAALEVATGSSEGKRCVVNTADNTVNYQRYAGVENGQEVWLRIAEGRVYQKPAPYAITLQGPDTTKALVAGPALTLTARVTQGGEAAANMPISLVVGGAVSGYTTNAAGEVVFAYVPPYRATTDLIVGYCNPCEGSTTKVITVEKCYVCGGEVGNPASPGDGSKRQDETDWQDAAAHPLSFTRHYRSLGITPAGIGINWSHAAAAQLVREPLKKQIASI